MRETIAWQRDKNSPIMNRVNGMVRKVVVRLASATGLWGLLGFVDGEGEPEKFHDVEVFSNVGFWSRPRSSAKAEAVVVHVGGETGQPVVIATRDKTIQIELDEDETAIFNSSVRVVLRKNGTVEIDDGGGAEPLATKAELKALADFVQGLFVGGTGSAVVPAGTVPQPTGTTVLKGK